VNAGNTDNFSLRLTVVKSRCAKLCFFALVQHKEYSMKKERKLNVVAAETAETEIEEIFTRYIAVCNQAIDRHRNTFPYRELLAAREKLLGEYIHVAIYDDNGIPEAVFMLHFKDDKLTFWQDVSSGMKKSWRLNRSYLRQVVEHPEKYLEHPERLDIDWLKNRLGL
jgi:hypothetical protein